MLERFFAAVKNFLKAFTSVSLVLLVGTAVIAANPSYGYAITALVTVLSVWTYRSPQPQFWIPNRTTAVTISFVAMMLLGVTWSEREKVAEEFQEKERLAELRKADPHAYLLAIADSARSEFFVSEARALLRESDPSEYLLIIRGKTAEDAFLRELQELDPAQYATEMERREQQRAARERADAEARRAALEVETKDLVARLPGARSLSVQEQHRIYARLAELVPSNAAYGKEASKLNTQLKLEETRQAARETPRLYVSIDKVQWAKAGFGNVMEATFVVRNSSPIDIKDLTIRCVHSAPSGTVIDSNTRTVYEVVKANSSRTFRDVNMGFIHSQAARTWCEITDAAAY